MNFRHLFTFILSCLLSTQMMAAQVTSQEDQFQKINFAYLKGDYLNALKNVNTFIDKLSGDELMIARAYFLKAKIQAAYGHFEEYNGAIDQANAHLAKGNPDQDQPQYIKVLMEAADAYTAAGDYLQAEQSMEKTRLFIQEKNINDSATTFAINVNMARVKFNQGFYNTALAYIPQLMNQAKARIVKKELYTDDKGRQVMKKLDSKELSARKRVYAILGNLMAEVYFENGNYKAADSVNKAMFIWIKKNLTTKDISGIDNYILKGRLLQINKKPQEAHKAFEKAEGLIRKTHYIKYKPQSREAMEVYQYLLPSFKEVNQEAKGKRLGKIVETRIKRYYGRDNIYYGRLQVTDAEKAIINDNWDKAEDILKELLSNYKMYPKDHIERVHLLNMINLVYMNTDRYEEAELALKETVVIMKSKVGDEAPVYHMQLLDLANYQVLYTDNFREAIPVYENSLNKVVKKELSHTHKKYLKYLEEEAQLFELLDEFSKAEAVLAEASKEITGTYGLTSVEYASILYKQARVEMYLGYYNKAQNMLEVSIGIFEDNQGPKVYEEFSNAMETYARFYIIQGRYTEARAAIKKAKTYLKRAKVDLNTSNVSEQLAYLYILMGKYDDTEKILNQSITVRGQRFGLMHRSLIAPLNQLGFLYYETEDYIQAEKVALRASEISVKIFGVNSLRNAESLSLLESIYMKIGDYDRAEQIGNQALQIQIKQFGEAHALVGHSMSELAYAKFKNGKPAKEIEDLYNRSLKIMKTSIGEDNPLYADVLVHAADFYIANGDLNKADEYLIKAEGIYKKSLGEDNTKIANVYISRGDLLAVKGKYQEALTYYNKSKDISYKLNGDLNTNYLRAYSRAGRMQYTLGNHKEAIAIMNVTTAGYQKIIKTVFSGYSERQKTGFWKQMKEDFDFYNTMAIVLKDQYPELLGNAYNFQLSNKALLLNSSIKVRQRIMNSNDPILIAEYKKWLDKKEQLTSALSMTTEARTENGIDINALEKDIDQLEKTLGEKSDIFASTYENKLVYDWKTVRENLKENEYAVEIIRFRYFTNKFTDTIYYAALIVSKDNSTGPSLVLLTNGKEMETRYDKYYRNSIRMRKEDHISYNIFFKALQEKIKPGATVYLSPDGVYNRINLETLLSSNGKYVIEEYRIVQVSNTRDIITRAKKKTTKSSDAKEQTRMALLIGNPKYYPVGDTLAHVISQLPGSEREVIELNTLLRDNGCKTALLLGDKATEESLKDMGTPNIVHIATHGFFLEDIAQTGIDIQVEDAAAQNPLLRSGLIFASGGPLMANNNPYEFNRGDGILTAYEAMNLDLDKAELVTMSACETGLGKVESGEGVYGLQRALMVAGAKSIMMSLFKVSDDVTMDLMKTFYANWMKTGDKRQALIDAKLYIMKKYKDPLYWGSFIMIGIE